MDSDIIETPFRTLEEFKYVHHLLYSEYLENKQEGLKMLYMWEARSESLPVGIEVTKHLVEAHIFDVTHKESDSVCVALQLKALFEVAIVRFVNLVCDKTKSNITRSLVGAAVKFGIPEYIVHFRHQIVHGLNTSSTATMREVILVALNIIENLYWKMLPNNCIPYVPPDPQILILELKGLLEEFRNLRHSILAKQDQPDITLKQSKCLERIFDIRKRKEALFLINIVKEGFFLVELDISTLLNQDNMLITTCGCSLNSQEGVLNRSCKHGCFFYKGEEGTFLPEIMIKFWEPFLQKLLDCNCLWDFTLQLARSLIAYSSKNCKKLGAAWIYNILLAYQRKATNTSLDVILKYLDLRVEKKGLLYACLEGAVIYYHPTVDELLIDLGSKWQKVSYLVHCTVDIISNRSENPDYASDAFTVWSSSGLFDLLPERKKYMFEPAEFDWTKIPFGSVLPCRSKRKIVTDTAETSSKWSKKILMSESPGDAIVLKNAIDGSYEFNLFRKHQYIMEMIEDCLQNFKI